MYVHPHVTQDGNLKRGVPQDEKIHEQGDGVFAEDREDPSKPDILVYSAPTTSTEGTLTSFNDEAITLITQFKQTGRVEYLDRAISSYQNALKLQDEVDLSRSTILSGLAIALLTRFDQLGQYQDLETAISLLRNTLQLRPAPLSDRSMSLNDLAGALLTRFEESGQYDDLEEAISLYRDALELRPPPHPDRPKSLNNLALALWQQFEQTGQHDGLEEAIQLHRCALDLRPPSHPDRSTSLNNLALALWTQVEQTGQHDDLDEVVSLHRAALELRPGSHPDRPTSLLNLANALSTRFELEGTPDDLEAAISLHREVVELRPPPHSRRSMSLNNLALALWTRFEQSGQHDDLEEAIELHREALRLRSGSHPDRSMSLDNLGVSLLTRYEQSGLRDDLEEAISLLRQALDLRPGTHPDRSATLNNLALALWTHYEHSSIREGLEEAISLHRTALGLRPASHPLRSSSLNNLGITLYSRFDAFGRLEDLEEAVLLHRAALVLQPKPHPGRPISLNNLANALSARFKQSGQHEDLEQAVALHRDALELQPASHPDRSKSLTNLAGTLLKRFEQLGQSRDLEEAIDLSYQPLNILVSGHPSFCFFSRYQGSILFTAYTHTQDPQTLHKAVDAYKVAIACEAAPPSLRFGYAKEWASLADSRHDSALDAYQTAIQLLPRLAMLGLDLPSRQQTLKYDSDGLARDAAACAIRAHQYDRAVELLEEGRAVFWSQALQLRTPITALHDIAPELEEKIRRISRELEQGSRRDVSKTMFDTSQTVMNIEHEASHFRRLNDEWLTVLEQVRQLEGFHNFLRPLKLSTLLGVTGKGPLVILNASKAACDALILNSTGVHHVPLGLDFTGVTQLVNCIQTATMPDSRNPPSSEPTEVEALLKLMPSLSRQDLERGAIERVSRSDLTFPHILEKLWKSAIEPIIRFLKLQKCEDLPRIWWCPTGPFAFLPIHAAGIYHTDQMECVSDYVVSSYTPTISALLRNIPLSATPSKMIIVTQPELPYTLKELQVIESRVPVTNNHLPIMELVKLESGTVEEVISHLQTASIAHFACHGTQNSMSPLESALLLKDGHLLTVQQIMEKSSSDPTLASLAFLAACQTAMGDKTLPDEVIHLGSTLLFAGFAGVVGTMWNISDADGPEVADAFYQYLFKETKSTTEDGFQLDTTRAARALHLAVTKLRSEHNVSFVRWVPFIHLGR